MSGIPTSVSPDPLVYAVLQQILNRLSNLENVALQIQHDQGVIMSDQSKLDADAAKVLADDDAILAAVNELKAQPGAAGLDFSGLDKAIAGEDSAVADVQGLEQPAPAPASEPQPVNANGNPIPTPTAAPDPSAPAQPAAAPVAVTDTNNAVQGQPVPPATPPAAG